MDTFTPLVLKVEPDSDVELDADPDYSPVKLQEDQKIEIVTKFKDELKSEELKEYEDSRGLFEDIKEGSYIISKIEVKDEVVSPDQFITTAADPEDPDWDCPICLKQLPVSMDLKEHLASHFTSPEHKNEPQCPLCGQKFNRLAKLYSHIVAVHKNDRKGVEDDQEEAIEEEKHSDYSDCNESDDNEEVIECKDNHSSSKGKGKVSEEKKLFACDQCPKSYDSKRSLSNHVSDYHNRNKTHNQCPRCMKVFTSIYNMKKHLVIHSNDRPFSCSVCTKTFKRSQGLTYHIKYVHGNAKGMSEDNESNCETCGKKFSTGRLLLMHQRQFHTKEGLFECSICEAKFPVAKELKRHMLVHSDERPFRCEVCGKGYKTNAHLQRHIFIHKHNATVTNKCKDCGEDIDNWDQHQKSCRNPKKKLFACVKCPKIYETRKQLANHVSMYHVKDNNCRQCPLCKKMFASPTAMQIHLKATHSNERPFSCSLCEKTFKRSEALKWHVKRAHETAKEKEAEM